MNKRGVSTATWAIPLIVLAIIVVVVASYAFYAFRDTIAAGVSQGYTNMGDFVAGSVGEGTQTALNALTYLFGPVPNQLKDRTPNEVSAIIIVIAMWFLLFITFGDIFASFSTFNSGVSWAIGGLLALMAANLNGVSFLVICFSAVFVALGTIGIFVGLFGAIIAFIIVNLGITSLGTWVMKRKLLIDSTRKDLATQAGAADFAAGVKATKAAAKAFRSMP